jgi:hypothetical protein
MEDYTDKSADSPDRKNARKKKSAAKTRSKSSYAKSKSADIGSMENNLRELGATIDRFTAQVNSAAGLNSKEFRKIKMEASARLSEFKTAADALSIY